MEKRRNIIDIWSRNDFICLRKRLGGGSEVNSGLFHEPDKKFFKAWSDTYDTLDLNIESVKPFLNEEEITNIDKNRTFTIRKYLQKYSQKDGSLLRNCIDSWEPLSQTKNSMTTTYLKKLFRIVERSLRMLMQKIYSRNGFWHVIVEHSTVKVIRCKNLFLCVWCNTHKFTSTEIFCFKR